MQTNLQRAAVLLDGFVETDRGGRLRLKYLKDGSPDELLARRALATLLRSREGLNYRLRESLAELFDPTPHALQQRKLTFAFRRRGKTTDHYANAQVFVEVYEAIRSGSKTAEAIADIAERFDIGEDLVKRLWLKYRRVYQAPIPAAAAG
jgi:hypothetical protein